MIPLGLAGPDCRKCELREGCGQVVWGQTVDGADLMVVGDHPGDEEDLMGEPFVSRKGRAVRRLIDLAHLTDRTAFTYAVKCFPSRKPNKTHQNACRGHLWAELQTVKPKVVLCLGSMTSTLLLNVTRLGNGPLEVERDGVRYRRELRKSKKAGSKELPRPAAQHDGALGLFHPVDYASFAVVPWYSPETLLNHGEAADRATAELLLKIRERLDVQGHRQAVRQDSGRQELCGQQVAS